MGDTKIEWTNKTWNPVRGCSVVSEGCRNCYAMNFATRFAKEGEPYEGLAYRNESGAHWTGKVRLIEEHLEDPLRWKKPARVFVNSMSDLFHESLTEIEIGQVFSVMAQCPQHIFQILTKRPQIMLETLRTARDVFDFGEPLPNVWLGVSVESQKTADERIPLLMETPAAVRWISAEPLLGPMNLEKWLCSCPTKCDHDSGMISCSTDGYFDWIVVGGESGPNARPMHPEWARSLRDQCVAAGVPFFFKQWGEWLPDEAMDVHTAEGLDQLVTCETGNRKQHQWWKGEPRNAINTGTSYRVGKKAAGRLLDGREWNDFPQAKAVSV